LYASREWPHLFVSLPLTLSSAFLLLKDRQRNRLAGRLTRVQPTPALDNARKNTERDAIAAACAALFRLRASVNSKLGVSNEFGKLEPSDAQESGEI
jgi:hypothetical protein